MDVIHITRLNKWKNDKGNKKLKCWLFQCRWSNAGSTLSTGLREAGSLPAKALEPQDTRSRLAHGLLIDSLNGVQNQQWLFPFCFRLASIQYFQEVKGR